MISLKKLTENKILDLFNQEKIVSVLKNPRQNPQETLLVVGILTMLFLIVLVLIVLLASFISSIRRRKRQRSKDKSEK